MARLTSTEPSDAAGGAPAAPPDAPAGRRRNRGRRWRGPLLGLAALTVLALLVVAAAVASLLAARGDLAGARDSARRGAAWLAAREPAAARGAFERAEEQFASGRDRLASGPARLAAVLPDGRRNLDAGAALAAAGASLAAAGADIAAVLEALPGGLAAFAPRDGVIPLEPIVALQEPLARAAERVDRAESNLADVPRSGLHPLLLDARAALAEVVTGQGGTVDAAEALSRALPAFLGASGPRRYFLGAANPAELRSAAGFIGAYAILTADGGRLTLEQFGSIHDLPNAPPEEVDAPDDDYVERYGRYGVPGFWLNLTMTPDFPTAATAIERLYEHVTDVPLDGAIVVDPYVLRALLELTGPVDVPSVGRVTADEVVGFVTNEAYALFDEAEARKQVLGVVAARVLQRFLDEGAQGDAVSAGRALAAAAAEGHLLLHASDPSVQQAFETAGVAGRLLDPPGDYAAVFANNGAGNKADFYQEREIAYSATLQEGGAVESQLQVRLTNHAPTSGQPHDVIGPYSEGFVAGENRSLLAVYCSSRCEPDDEVVVDGRAVPLDAERELGHPVLTVLARLLSGESRDYRFGWRTSDAWEPTTDGGGIYRLTYQGQFLVQPVALAVEVRLPEGAQVVESSPDVTVEGETVRWSATPGRTTQLTVRFAMRAR